MRQCQKLVCECKMSFNELQGEYGIVKCINNSISNILLICRLCDEDQITEYIFHFIATGKKGYAFLYNSHYLMGVGKQTFGYICLTNLHQNLFISHLLI